MKFSNRNKAADKITLTGIPLEAYNYKYIVNGKPALEWVTERYQLTRDKV